MIAKPERRVFTPAFAPRTARFPRQVAGDLGYTVGACYTSMTGFRRAATHGCGTVQLVCTYALLRRCGFAFWDLGMVMKYKEQLGARVVTRREFVEMFYPVRSTPCELHIPAAAAVVPEEEEGEKEEEEKEEEEEHEATPAPAATTQAPAAAAAVAAAAAAAAAAAEPVAEAKQTASAAPAAPLPDHAVAAEARKSKRGGGGGASGGGGVGGGGNSGGGRSKATRRSPDATTSLGLSSQKVGATGVAVPAVHAETLVREALAMQALVQMPSVSRGVGGGGRGGGGGADAAAGAGSDARVAAVARAASSPAEK